MTKKCPFFRSKCKQHDCELYEKIEGINPQTGERIDIYGCTIKHIPLLLIENAQQQRSTGAAVESFRNEIVESNKSSAKLFGLMTAAITQAAALEHKE